MIDEKFDQRTFPGSSDTGDNFNNRLIPPFGKPADIKLSVMHETY